jgi:hypothetical protein
LPNCTTSALRVGLRNGDAHEALGAHELGHLEGIAALVRAFEGTFLQMREREFAHAVGEQLLFVGEFKIHE